MLKKILEFPVAHSWTKIPSQVVADGGFGVDRGRGRNHLCGQCLQLYPFLCTLDSSTEWDCMEVGAFSFCFWHLCPLGQMTFWFLHDLSMPSMTFTGPSLPEAWRANIWRTIRIQQCCSRWADVHFQSFSIQRLRWKLREERKAMAKMAMAKKIKEACVKHQPHASHPLISYIILS